jgi:hypothetical protein
VGENLHQEGDNAGGIRIALPTGAQLYTYVPSACSATHGIQVELEFLPTVPGAVLDWRLPFDVQIEGAQYIAAQHSQQQLQGATT